MIAANVVIVARNILADIRAATGVQAAMGIAMNRRLMPSMWSVAARRAAVIDENAAPCSRISGIANCA